MGYISRFGSQTKQFLQLNAVRIGLILATFLLIILFGYAITSNTILILGSGLILLFIIIKYDPLLYLAVLFFSLSIIPRINNFGPFASLRVDQMLVPVFLITAVIFPTLLRKKRRLWDTATKRFLFTFGIYIIAIISAMILQLLIQETGNPTSFSYYLYLFKTIELAALFIIVYDLIRQSPDLGQKVLFLLILCFLVISLIGILQKIDVPLITNYLQTYFRRETGNGYPYVRVSSVFEAVSTYFGTFLAAVDIFLISLAINHPNKLFRWLFFIAAGIGSITLLLTQAILAIIVFLTNICILSILNRQKLGRMVIFIIILSLLVLAVLNSFPGGLEHLFLEDLNDSSLDPRIYTWGINFNLIFSSASRALTGVSMETSGIPESQYVLELWKTGLIGLISYLAMLISATWFFWRSFRTNLKPLSKGFALGTFLVLFTFIFTGFGYASFEAGRLVEWFMIILAIGYAHMAEANETTLVEKH